jgi:hypothetical protein
MAMPNVAVAKRVRGIEPASNHGPVIRASQLRITKSLVLGVQFWRRPDIFRSPARLVNLRSSRYRAVQEESVEAPTFVGSSLQKF